jgi:hypothetical protein
MSVPPERKLQLADIMAVDADNPDRRRQTLTEQSVGISGRSNMAFRSISCLAMNLCIAKRTFGMFRVTCKLGRNQKSVQALSAE